jgi:hypothetical protein
MPLPPVGYLLQSVPLTESAHLSRGHCSPAVIHPRSEPPDRHPSPLVSPTPTLSRSRLVPPAATNSLSARRVLTSRSLWIPDRLTAPSRALHLLRSLVPPASPFTPGQVSLTLTADALLVFCPFRAFAPRTSGPPPARVSPSHSLPPGGSSAYERTSRPSRRVRRIPHRSAEPPRR